MKKILLLLLLLNAVAYAKPTVVVSILPEKTFVKKIAKDTLNVVVMVQPGSSPHSYEPKSSQMVAISQADTYFSIGIEFEQVWLERFKAQNKNLKIIDMSTNVAKIETEEHHQHASEIHDEEHDPHTWTSPKNVALMAHTIYETLVKAYPQHKSLYKVNLESFLAEINATDTEIKHILKDVAPKSKFMVFHPSWGYFAKDYNLEQLAVEINGKNPKPREMVMIIKEAKENKIHTIFTQPEFSDKNAKVIANEVGAKVHRVSPLNPNWSKNLIQMAEVIAK